MQKMKQTPQYVPHLPITLNQEQIEIVDDFKYLGSLVASTSADIKMRKGQACAAFWKLKDI